MIASFIAQLDVVRDVTPAQARFIASRSRAHYASASEQRVEAALRCDPEWPLFSCNEIVPIEGFGLQPRVDLLWRDGRVVVELDGPEHQADPNFANDRHRDYELLYLGDLALRITNDQAETDLQHAIEKICALVRFRRALRVLWAWVPEKVEVAPRRPPSHPLTRVCRSCEVIMNRNGVELMSDKLTPKQTLLIWCLLGCHGEALQRSIVPRVEAKDRKVLVARGLISEGRHGQSIVLRVEDKGWRWASEHLRDELPPNFRMLQQWLSRVHDFLAETDRPLADFIGLPMESLPLLPPKKPRPLESVSRP